MSKCLESTKLGENLTLAECTDGFWLYDGTHGMNLSMRAKTATAALVEALEYYQDRLKQVEIDYRLLKGKVDIFLEQFEESDD